MSNGVEGGFTLPGEAGYEDLTLRMAKKWGADVIRDSDGTQLSEEITSAGYDIYSTVCLVRDDLEWAYSNMDKLQQNYLMSFPVIAENENVSIDILKGYFTEQFKINSQDDPKEWWQVYDRTSGDEVPASKWSFDPSKGIVLIENITPWHKYTVNFLVYRIWEEISMYNHITNNWGAKRHMMAVDPIYPETQEHILRYLEEWLIKHPDTNVVRFTSMFYNFCWFWGSNPNLRFIYSDWGSYDFTVNPYALKMFEKVHGYRLCSEDFVNKGQYNSTHNVPTERYRAWMDFINNFVVDFGSRCIELVHRYWKKAYVFYDDHWIGVEPYGDRFKDFKFDGIIKCVFNAFEARLCAGVKGVRIHELRLHPYLFPTGLNGEPTFKDGGNPKLDAQKFWVNVRRALLRAPVERIGLGGYLHLVEYFPEFNDYIEDVANEFRMLKSLHYNDMPYTAPFRVAVLTAWGKLRSWSCSGHMHEHPELELIRVIEALAGLPMDVEFISFDDIRNNGIPKGVKVLINAGGLDSAWSGGFNWYDPDVTGKVTEWVANGGGFIGIGEPSSARYSSQYFQLSHLLGVDREVGLTKCKMKYKYNKQIEKHFIMEDIEDVLDFGKDIDNLYIVDGNTDVLVESNGSPQLTVRRFKNGRSIYMSGFKFTSAIVRLLHRALYWASGYESEYGDWICTNTLTECAYYPAHKKLVIINNSDQIAKTNVLYQQKCIDNIVICPFGAEIINCDL
jgi:1,3-beta-galactosyl-N-acetylhexosamine phosphorylase